MGMSPNNCQGCGHGVKAYGAYWNEGRELFLCKKCHTRELKETLSRQLKTGSILVNLWGYDQTNADFFEVVSRTRATVTVRPIASEEESDGPTSMTGRARAIPGQYTGPPIQRRIGPGSVMVGRSSHQFAMPVEREWYGVSSYA